jgi:hypothetical protein
MGEEGRGGEGSDGAAPVRFSSLLGIGDHRLRAGRAFRNSWMTVTV